MSALRGCTGDRVSSFVDFIVIGAGMAGVSVAAHLAERGKVLLLERENQPAYHATGRSAALFSEVYGNETIRALTRASRTTFFDPPAQAAGELVRPRATLYFAGDDKRKQLLEHQQSPGVRENTRLVGRDEIARRLPILRPQAATWGLLEEGSADIEVHELLQMYLRRFTSHGGERRFDAEVTALAREDGVWVAHHPAGVSRAPIVVNAAGAWGDVVAGLAGVAPLGLRPLRRTALLVEAPTGCDIASWPAAVDADESFYFKPDAGLLLLSPADESPSAPCDAQPEELDVALAVERYCAATGAEVRRLRSTWAGLRTFSPDRTPVVGFDARAPGFFWLVGQGGYGIQTAPAMARLAASLACDEGVPSDIAAQGVLEPAVSPRRFAEQAA
jgi:D-arginine dehydrogenase